MEIALELAARARAASAEGRHYEAAKLYKKALFALARPRLVSAVNEVQSHGDAKAPHYPAAGAA
jgi:hypothetical protein